jgi:hypothetical protein
MGWLVERKRGRSARRELAALLVYLLMASWS